jgi:hypothetical protein
LIKDGHESSPFIVAFALVSNCVINCVFGEFLKEYLLRGKDPLFLEYRNTQTSTAKKIISWS